MDLDIIAIGSATRDIFVVPDELIVIDNKKDILRQKLLAFECGAKIGAELIESHAGGTAINVSVGFSRLGFKAAPLCVIGEDDPGQAILEFLTKEKIPSVLIEVLEGERTDQSLVMLEKATRERTIFVYKKAAEKLEIDLSLSMTTSIYVSSLKHDWEAKLKKIKEYVTTNGTRLFFTPGAAQLQAGLEGIKDFLASVEVIFLNEDEATELTLTKSKPDVVKMAKAIEGYGPKIVVITRGENGAFAYQAGEVFEHPIKRVDVKDITGAGDAFASGFLGAHLSGKGVKEALQWGIINSGSVVSHVGTLKGLLTREQLEDAQ